MCKSIAFFITFVLINVLLMKNFLSVVYVGCVMVLFSACTTLNPITFERLYAAETSFPEQINTVGVVNYVPPFKVGEEKMKYTSGYLEGDGKVAAEVLAEEIAANNYFSQVIICDSALRMKVDESEWNQPIPSLKADSLIRALEVDMLFAVERVQVQLQENKYWNSDSWGKITVVNLITTPVVRIYIPNRPAPLFTVSKSDTIYWEPGLVQTSSQVAHDASVHSAEMLMGHLLPHWEEVERYYFDGGNAIMRDAGIFVREDNWEEAGKIWQEIFETKKGKAKMRAAYNLAVYSEMKDDFGVAKGYLDAAYALAKEGSWEQQLILFYQMKMEEERQKNQRLSVQMKRFE